MNQAMKDWNTYQKVKKAAYSLFETALKFEPEDTRRITRAFEQGRLALI